jgi:hypothetical protein
VGQRHEWLYSYVPCSKKTNVRVGIQNSHLDGAHNGYGSGDERAHLSEGLDCLRKIQEVYQRKCHKKIYSKISKPQHISLG